MSIITRYLFEDNANDSVGSWNLTEGGSPSYTASGAPNKNKAIIFDGSTQYCMRADTTVTGFSALTIMLWVYPDTFANQLCMLTFMRRNINDDDVQLRFRLSGTSGGTTLQLRAGATPATESFNSADGTLIASRWNFVAIRYDDPDVDVYVDSTVDQSNLASVISTTHSVGGAIAATALSGNRDLVIGAGKNATTSFRDYFDGMMDDVVIDNAALTTGQMEAIRDEDQAGAAAASIALPGRRRYFQQLILH